MTPADTARNEAARQAVALVFTIAAALAVMTIQRRMLRGVLPGGPTPLEDAAGRERRWGRAAVWLWHAGFLRPARWAEMRSEQARRDYERERS
jgi:hypothetical protein